MERRIGRAEDAVRHFPDFPDVAWDDIRGAYRRPDRSPLASHAAFTGSVLGRAFGLGLLAYVLITGGFQIAADAQHRSLDGVFVHAPLYFWGAAGFFAVITLMNQVVDRGMGVPERSEDALISTTLDVVAACGRLAGAAIGRERAESIGDIHRTVRLLSNQLRKNARWAAGVPWYGGRAALIAHARRVRRQLAEPLDALVTAERDAALRRLSGYALATATAQARGLYGELLAEADLPPDPGPERGRWLRLLLVGATVAASGAVAVFVLTRTMGVSGEAAMAPLGLVLLYSAVAAAKATNTWTLISSVLDRTSRARQGGSPPHGP
ncbi:hypothetical protein [Streptomyces sp. HUAS TT7]|uniref:hypothetical protein n=1 Tax=Streptomyces sp. HUAS TT7 TaxID=3447507 RepID=UPI003F6574E2